jgi:DNA-binding response OmpR family regulator
MVRDIVVNNKKILVVDDEDLIRDMLEKAFGRIGISVCSVASGEEALEVLAHEYIPVMFIDLGLEKMSGFDLCQQIRKDNPDIVIYALTAYVKLFGQQEILGAGFNDCFSKPVSLKTLYSAVKEAFIKVNKLALAKIIKPIERVLIIDDDDDFRKNLAKMLEIEGFEVIEASDVEEGIKHQSEKPSDLIIVELILSQKRGLDLIVNIMNKYPETRFIAVSKGGGYFSEIEFSIAQTLGAVTLEKPFQREEMLNAIEQLQK